MRWHDNMLGLFSVDDERTTLVEKIKWLLFLRVVTLSFFLGAAALFHFFGTNSEPAFFHTLLIPLVAAYVISICSAVLLRRISNLRWFAHAQIGFDGLLITGILWITGGISSPFSFLYNLAVMNGAILLFHRGAFITAGFSSVCYAALLILSYADEQAIVNSVSLMPIASNMASFFVIGWLSAYLTRKLCEAEKLLHEKHADYQRLDSLKNALLEGVGSGVAITDTRGYINYFNAQAQQLTSVNESLITGKRLDEIFPSLKYRFDGAEQGKVVPHEFPFTCSRGQSKQLRLNLAPLCNAGGQFIGHVAIFEDITKQKEIEEKVRLEEELRRAREFDLSRESDDPSSSEFEFEGVVGKSGGMDKIYQLIQKVAAGSSNVLISGESGTGKELVARAIHINGSRRDKPFVAVNCGAIPETLIESELFGHVRGAFTGAVADHAGLFKQADQGTIFLDEVGELPLHLQVKLLRVLQEKSFTPVGGSKQTKVDARVISATNKDLRKEMESGRFREDLFYRLNVVQMVLPPLRHRREDIPVLAHYFLRKFATSHDKQVEEISSNALMRLMSYPYPGNVRELENVLEHAVAVATRNVITEDDLPVQLKNVPDIEKSQDPHAITDQNPEKFFSKGISLDRELESHERTILVGALKRANGVQKRAAELLGINYRSLRHRLDKYDLLGRQHNFPDDGKTTEVTKSVIGLGDEL
jgi:two-component system response regulator PilR (NtrC family)